MLSHRIVSGIASILISCGTAHAECGDVTGDGDVTTQDALRTLRRSVGQSVAMDCSQSDPPINGLAFANRVTCNGSDPHAKLKWSEHASLEWQTNLSTKHPLLTSDFERVDDLVLGGELTAAFGQCGEVELNLDAAAVAFLLPNHAGSFVSTEYQASNNTVYFYLQIAPVPMESAALLSESTVGSWTTVLGGVPAPAGLSSAIDD
jgi:hypothetical protein